MRHRTKYILRPTRLQNFAYFLAYVSTSGMMFFCGMLYAMHGG